MNNELKEWERVCNEHLRYIKKLKKEKNQSIRMLVIARNELFNEYGYETELIKELDKFIGEH
jgi:hypothetical protein